jgi:hypothetical protein
MEDLVMDESRETRSVAGEVERAVQLAMNGSYACRAGKGTRDRD